MSNVFSGLLAKLSKRRKKKNKPQPVVPEPKNLVWDEETGIYMGRPKFITLGVRNHVSGTIHGNVTQVGNTQYDEAMSVAERSMVVPVEVFYERREGSSGSDDQG